MCPLCGRPSFDVEAKANIDTKAYKLCWQHWAETQTRRINRLFEMIEQSPNIKHFSWDESWHYPKGEFSANDPGTLGGEKRRVVRKSEPMAG